MSRVRWREQRGEYWHPGHGFERGHARCLLDGSARSGHHTVGTGSEPRLCLKVGARLPRLLVVDDDASHSRVTAIGLRIDGFEVETAKGADAALELMAGQAFDVAVVDLMLPGTNGIQLARLIRASHPETRIVLTSAYHLSERQLVRVDCGAVGFVPKPFDLTELAAFLRSKLSGDDRPRPMTQSGAAA
jgi:DNA-binding NtrC family response regulator